MSERLDVFLMGAGAALSARKTVIVEPRPDTELTAIFPFIADTRFLTIVRPDPESPNFLIMAILERR